MTVGTDPMAKINEHTSIDDDALQYNSTFDGSLSPERTSPILSVTLKEFNSHDDKNRNKNKNANEKRDEISIGNENENEIENENVNEDVCPETRARRLSLSIFPRDRDDVLLNFKEKVEQCNAHLIKCATQVAILKDLILKDLLNLSLVVHEPELWQRLVNFNPNLNFFCQLSSIYIFNLLMHSYVHCILYNSTYILCSLGRVYHFNFNFNLCVFCRSFPADVYKPLLTCFTNVMKSTRSVASATKSFR